MLETLDPVNNLRINPLFTSTSIKTSEAQTHSKNTLPRIYICIFRAPRIDRFASSRRAACSASGLNTIVCIGELVTVRASVVVIYVLPR